MISKLSVGTAQLSRNYGIKNNKKILSINDMEQILLRCSELGINSLDTAQSYGESEKQLGILGISQFYVTTKITIPKGCPDIAFEVEKLIDLSLKNLKLDHIENVLIHNTENLSQSEFGKIFNAILSQKEQKKINNFGYSIYNPSHLRILIGFEKPDIIQFPYNIFDQRISDDGLLDKLKSLSIICQCRSIFLQGLLLENSIDHQYFNKWDYLFKKWFAWLSRHEIKNMQALINFVVSNKKIDKIIVGCKSYDEFSEIVDNFMNTSDLFPSKIKINDEKLLNPYNWYN
jgi:aryl-alcohol dehydrogenase-like predicted oxidoreductase